jgi:Ser/Thr protein kinase RdoA (MazF antagonist)
VNGRAARDFASLTPRGRHGRLRSLALDAMRGYDVEVGRCSVVAEAFNTVFRVDAADGARYALRMSPNLRIHADGCEQAEAAWVTALRNDVGFPTPAVISARDGSPVVAVTAPGVPGVRTCVLFEWVPGRRLRDGVTAELVRKTGELAAITHEHGAAHATDAAPAGVLVADRPCYFRVADRLGELRPAYGSALADAVDRAQRVLDGLWRDPPHRPHLLHGDLQSGNVMVSRGKVVLIDFQDVVWGFEVQDAVFALVALEQQGFGALAGTFRAGYEAVRPWPDAEPDTIAALAAARHLNILNFGLSIARPGLDEFVARHAARVVEWVDPGRKG